MAEAFEKSVAKLAAEMGAFPEEAYNFVREGLSYAVHAVHGPETPAQTAVMRYLAQHDLDVCDLAELYETGRLTQELQAAIEEAGGIEKLNRHVTGAELSWGLRDYARLRWGLLARGVLESWKIRSTDDFGRIVFHMIGHGLLQKQPGDSLDDFHDVFDFAEALDRDYPFTFKGE